MLRRLAPVLLSLAMVGVAHGQGLRRWALIYAAGRGHPRYASDLLESTLYTDSSGHSARLFDGVVCLEVTSPLGRSFQNWQKGPPGREDYAGYLDTLLAQNGPLARADSVVGAHGDSLAVTIMVPYPLGKATAQADERTPFLEWYLGRADSLFKARGFGHLRLWGFYWLGEGITRNDTLVVQHMSQIAHARGFKTMWIPFYTSELAERWKDLGFDVAFLQPNYFFTPSLDASRMDSAVARATRWGMNLEVEFDHRLVDDSQFAGRLTPYVEAITEAGAKTFPDIAVYDGAGALYKLQRSGTPRGKRAYRRLVELLLRY